MSDKSDTEQGPVCTQGSNIMYAWAMDAEELHLPNGQWCVSCDVVRDGVKG